MDVENNKDGKPKEEELENEIEKETGENVEVDTNEEGTNVEKEEPNVPKDNVEIMATLNEILKEIKILTNAQAGDIIEETEEPEEQNDDSLTDELDRLLG